MVNGLGHKIFINDLMFDTMIWLIGIKNNVYQSEFDISSEQYYLPIAKANVERV